MTYIHVTRTPQMGFGDYRGVRDALGPEPIKGRVSHHVGQSNGSLCIVDVWDSKADADRFAGERLFPAFQQVGVKPNPDSVLLEFDADDE